LQNYRKIIGLIDISFVVYAIYLSEDAGAVFYR